MFTGIVEGVGQILEIKPRPQQLQIKIQSPFPLKGTQLGDSIAIDGCCLTVTRFQKDWFTADISPETLKRTTLGDLKKGTRVNLERPVRLADRLGGHLVQGHVDGVGKILATRKVQGPGETYFLIDIEIPKVLQDLVVEKGSIAIDGISLTVNAVKGRKISLCIIPHTQEKTTLTAKKAGARVNIEVDVIVKYVEKLLDRSLKKRGLKK